MAVARTDDNATLVGELRGEHWPLLDPLFERTGGAVTFKGNANVADLNATPLHARRFRRIRRRNACRHRQP
jgi:hypothetical protein